MPRKKTIVTTEEVEEPKDQEIDYKRDLENKSMLEVSLDTPEELKEEPKVEEKPVEEETETVEFDPEAFKKEVAEQTRNDLLESLKGKNAKETEENVSHYQEFQKDFFTKNNRQPTWFEVAEDMEEQAIKKFEARQEDKVKQQEEEKTQQTKALEDQNTATNKYVEDTLNELYEGEKLPRIQDKKDKDDYGLRVQQSLLAKVVEINSERIKNNIPPKTIKEIFYEDFKVPRKEVAGADAPVNMGRGGYSPDDSEEIDYIRDIQGERNSFRNIIRKATGRG